MSKIKREQGCRCHFSINGDHLYGGYIGCPIHDPNTFTTIPLDRIYVWDLDDVKQLQEIAKQIHKDNAAEVCDARDDEGSGAA